MPQALSARHSAQYDYVCLFAVLLLLINDNSMGFLNFTFKDCSWLCSRINGHLQSCHVVYFQPPVEKINSYIPITGKFKVTNLLLLSVPI